MNYAEERAALARLLLALGPYRGDLVLIGGAAQGLFRLHPLSQPVDFPPLLTQDVDLALPAQLPLQEEDLRQLLLAAGFSERFLGKEHPPVTHYQLGDAPTFYAEFLVPLIGGSTHRHGGSEVTAQVAGVTAQRLRYLELLLVNPWSVLLTEPDYPVGPHALEVRIGNATSYLAQKLLILPRRTLPDRAKDVLYIHDTLLTFGRSLGALRALWINTIRLLLHPRAAQLLRRAPMTLFSEVTDLARQAARVGAEAGRAHSPDDIAAVCRRGLAEIFT